MRSQSSTQSYDVAESVCTSNPDEEGYQDQGSSQISDQPEQIRLRQMLNKTSSNLPAIGNRGEAKTEREANKRIRENQKFQSMWDSGYRPEHEELKKERSSSRPPKRASSQVGDFFSRLFLKFK